MFEAIVFFSLLIVVSVEMVYRPAFELLRHWKDT